MANEDALREESVRSNCTSCGGFDLPYMKKGFGKFPGIRLGNPCYFRKNNSFYWDKGTVHRIVLKQDFNGRVLNDEGEAQLSVFGGDIEYLYIREDETDKIFVVESNCVAVRHPIRQWLCVGHRVVAKSRHKRFPEKWHVIVSYLFNMGIGDRTFKVLKLCGGVIIEQASHLSYHGSLVLFDDGSIGYAGNSGIRLAIYWTWRRVWKDTLASQEHQDLVQAFIQKFPEREVHVLNVGDSVRIIFNDQQVDATVEEVDRSMMKVSFHMKDKANQGGNRSVKEWIHRSSSRIIMQ